MDSHQKTTSRRRFLSSVAVHFAAVSSSPGFAIMQDPVLNHLEEKFPQETAVLGRLFDHTTNSYKLYWFKAILSLIPHCDESGVPVADVLREMVVIAWHTVTFFRLSLGRQDMLQQVIDAIRLRAAVDPQSPQRTIRDMLLSSPEFDSEISRVGTYVPQRFLTPWFSPELSRLPDTRKNAMIVKLAKERHATTSPPMYDFADRDGVSVIRIHPAWRRFLVENLAVLRSFADFHLVDYLQRRNPSTPGIIHKLELPLSRDLAYARRFWEVVRIRLEAEGKGNLFRDIYAGVPLDDAFTIDHFVPWSFVMHDLIWNLTPVTRSTNSSKGDRVPSLERYLAPFAELHHQAIRFATSNRTAADMYIDCFRQDVASLASMPFDAFRTRVQDVIMPLATVAGNQGFETEWLAQTAS